MASSSGSFLIRTVFSGGDACHLQRTEYSKPIDDSEQKNGTWYDRKDLLLALYDAYACASRIASVPSR